MLRFAIEKALIYKMQKIFKRWNNYTNSIISFKSKILKKLITRAFKALKQ